MNLDDVASMLDGEEEEDSPTPIEQRARPSGSTLRPQEPPFPPPGHSEKKRNQTKRDAPPNSGENTPPWKKRREED